MRNHRRSKGRDLRQQVSEDPKHDGRKESWTRRRWDWNRDKAEKGESKGTRRSQSGGGAGTTAERRERQLEIVQLQATTDADKEWILLFLHCTLRECCLMLMMCIQHEPRSSCTLSLFDVMMYVCCLLFSYLDLECIQHKTE